MPCHGWCAISRSPYQQTASAEMLFFFFLSLLAGVWASHPQAPVAGRSVALLDNYQRMENPDISLDENTKMALRLTVELGCRNYAHHHSNLRYESEAIASRVYFSSLESALQMFFPGCIIAKLRDIEKHSPMASKVPPYVVTTAGKYGTGFYTDLSSPTVWIQFDPSQPKASARLRAFLTSNSKCFDILCLQGIQRSFLARLFSLPDSIKRVIGNDTSTSQAAFRCAIVHTVECAFSATTPELYKKAIYNGLSSYFSELELHRYVFSPNVSYIAKVLEFTVYKRNFPLMFFTNESKLMIKGCVPVHTHFYGIPKKMGMIVTSFPRQVFVIYFKRVNIKALGIMHNLLHHFADKLKGFNLKKHDRFLELFEKKPAGRAVE